MRTKVWTLTLLIAGWALQVEAQDGPAGLLKANTASTGTTAVATSGFEAATPIEKDANDATELQASAGGNVAQGNSRSQNITLASRFRMRREANQLSAAAALNYGRSAIDANADGSTRDDKMQTNVQNVQGKVRYDRFLSERLAVFLGVSVLTDKFQKLDLRLNIDPGLAYYFVDAEKQRLWGELGYDMQYDINNDDALVPMSGTDKRELTHNARLFAGYENSLTDSASFHAGVEWLLNVEDTGDNRVAFDTGLTSQIGAGFAMGVTLQIHYDHDPLPGVQTTDVVTALNLQYTVL